MINSVLQLTTEAIRFIEHQAAAQDQSPEDFVLRAVGYSQQNSEEYEYTTNDFNEETLKAIREMEKTRDTLKRYDDVEELFTDILGPNWKDA